MSKSVDVKGSVTALVPHVTTATFLQYSNKIRRAPIQRVAIESHAAMLKALAAIVPNLGIGKLDMEEILSGVAETQLEFKNKKEKKRWAVEMGKRMRGICRHVQQYRVKRESAPAWFRQLGFASVDEAVDEECGEEGAEEETEFEPDEEVDAEEEDEMPVSKLNKRPSTDDVVLKRPSAKDAAESQYEYFWDKENRIACRKQRQGKQSAHPEMALEVFWPEGAKSTDPVHARFKDGDTWVCPHITVGSYQAEKDQSAAAGKKRASSGGASSSGAPRVDEKLFSGKSSNNEDVHVLMRWDQPKDKPRVRLCCIKVTGSPQLLQMNIESFNLHPHGELESERRTILWCNNIAERYCRGDLTQEMAKALKTEYMKNLAMVATQGSKDTEETEDSKGVLKRPAAAKAEAGSAKAAKVEASPEEKPEAKPKAKADPPATPKKRPAASPPAAAPKASPPSAAAASPAVEAPRRKSRISPPPTSDDD